MTEEPDGTPGPLSLAVAYATAGRDALARHAQDEAILAYQHALPLAAAAVAAVPAGDDTHPDLVRFLVYVHDVLGGLLLGRGDLDSAERHYSAALRLSSELDPASPDVAKFTSNLGSVARHRGDLDLALGLYRTAAELASRCEPVPDATATYLSNAGTVLLALGDLDAALDLFRRALDIDERTDPAAAATDLSLLGSVFLESGRIAEAREHFQRAIDVHSALDPQSADTARDLVNLGYCHRLTGDLDQALRHYYAALDIDRALGPASLETAGDLNNISQVYQMRGNPGRAQDYLEQALAISRTAAPRSQRTATQLNNLASLRVRQRRYDEARTLLEEALRIDRAVAPRSLETARDLGNLGAVAVDRGELDLAADYCRQALALYRDAGPDTASVAVLHTTLSIVAYGRGDRGGALAHTRAAYEIDRQQVPDDEPTVTDLINLAFLHAEGDELDEAIARYDEAVDLAESLRRRAGTAQAREERFVLLQSPYQGLVRALLRRGADGDAERAFDVAERARGRALADLLARNEIAVRPDDSAQRSLLTEERNAEHELAAISRLLAAHQPDPADPADRVRDDALRRRHAVSEHLERLRMELRTVFPAYATLRDPQPLGLDAARRLLSPGTVLLCYHIGEHGSAAWAVRQGDWAAAELPVTWPALLPLVDAALASCRSAQPETAETAAAWERLGHLLLDPVPGGWLSAAARVLVVADGPLLYLPFELLPYASGKLTDLTTVSYAPSVSVLGDLTRRAASPRDSRPDEEYTRAFLGIGLTDTGLAGELAPLPGGREVNEIAADYGPGARVVSGAEATKDLILSETGGYRVVHFATHGVIDDAEPLYSGLRVAAGQDGETDGPGGDNVLHVYEMFGLALSGAVVVCSACETARGKLQAGEGLVGMSRALFYAGAIALVVALWPVPDGPTRRLMRVFHRYLRDGRTPAEALSLAKHAVRASHPHVYQDPYTWAGFIALGAA